MANRFPLTINTTNSTIEELPAGDNLDLAGSNIVNINGITATANIQGSYFLGNGSQLTGISTGASGSNTQVQFNDDGAFNGDTGLVYNKTTTTLTANNLNVGGLTDLGSVANVTITGGTDGQVLTTNGSGDLSFATVSATSYALEPVRCCVTFNVTLSGLATYDSVTLLEGDRILVTAQTVTTTNGIYIASAGAWTRSSDFTLGSPTYRGGVIVPVSNGFLNKNTLWQCTNTGIIAANNVITFVATGTNGFIAISPIISAQPFITPGIFSSIVIGDSAKSSGSQSVAIGYGSNVTSSYTTAVGFNAKATTIGSTAFGVGANAAGTRSVAIGECNSIGDNSVSIGIGSKSATSSVSIGANAGSITQGIQTVAVGYDAGRSGQGQNATAVGYRAGNISQGQFSVAVGFNSGNNTQGGQAVAIGYAAGTVTQGTNAISIGTFAGAVNQGANSISIGSFTGYTNQAVNSIILNATGANVDQTTANTFTVKPVRANTTTNVMYYNTTSGEISYGGVPAAVPGGSNKQVQFNNDGTFGGSVLEYDPTASSFTFNATVFAGTMYTASIETSSIKPIAYIETPTSVNFLSGTTTLSLNNYSVFKYLIDGNTTISNFNNLPVNGKCRLFITTDTSSAYTITWPSDAKFSGGVNTIATGTAGLTSIIDIYYDGSYYYCDMHAGYI